MRFKNYINSHNKRNRIYSDDDLYKMTLADLINQEQVLTTQNSMIGIPNKIELEESPNTEWIKPFTNSDGKQDGGYWQSILTPDFINQYESLVPKTINSDPEFAPNKQMFPFDKNSNNILNQNAQQKQDIWQSSELQLDGGITKTRVPVIQDPIDNVKENVGNIAKKYEGLDGITAAQKATSKVIPATHVDYYGLASRFKDGDKIPNRILKENNIYSLGEIEDRQKYEEYAKDIARYKGLDINNPKTLEEIKNTKVVTPNENSRLYESIKNDEAFKNWLSENYEKIKQGDDSYNKSIEFPLENLSDSRARRNTAGTIHKADMKNAKINKDGSVSIDLRDWYDFANLEVKESKGLHKIITEANNRAYDQQEAGQLENYLMNVLIHVSPEELEEMLKGQKMQI